MQARLAGISIIRSPAADARQRRTASPSIAGPAAASRRRCRLAAVLTTLLLACASDPLAADLSAYAPMLLTARQDLQSTDAQFRRSASTDKAASARQFEAVETALTAAREPLSHFSARTPQVKAIADQVRRAFDMMIAAVQLKRTAQRNKQDSLGQMADALLANGLMSFLQADDKFAALAGEKEPTRAR